MDESGVMIKAMTSQAWELAPPSIAARISSSRAMFTTALSSLEISAQIAFCDVMSNYRGHASENVKLYSLDKPHLRICDGELDKKAYAVTKFSP
jgi:hypothetical protein